MNHCRECKDSGFCVWCGGAGRERMALVCRSCHGSGICLSCGGPKISKTPCDSGQPTHTESNAAVRVSSAAESQIEEFEDIRFLLNQSMV